MGRNICADFETCDDRLLTGGLPTKVRVWAWAACDVDTLDTTFGCDIASFIEHLSTVKGTYYFHNLAFDGTHIIDYLLKHGFRYVHDKKQLEAETFTALISKQGKFYSMRIRFRAGHDVEIRDSLKKLPMSVRALAQTFNLPEGKGEIDYRLWRGPGYVMTEEERDYIRRDVQIVAQALKTQLDDGYTKLTIGSDCMAFYKETVGKNFDRWFPTLNIIQDDAIRLSYKGGYVRVNPELKGIDIWGGISVDYNSMYPSQMLLKPFPYGRPKYFTGEYAPNEKYPLYVQKLTCSFNLLPGHFPTVQLRKGGFYGIHEYAEDSRGPVTLTLTSVDLALLFLNYDVDVLRWEGGYMFRAMTGMFADYIAFWRDVKEHSTGGLRYLAKLFLNNLYGKYGTNPDCTGKYPVLEGDCVKLVTGKPEQREPVYVPVACFATAYARDELIRAALANRDRFIYCDTDSLHLVGTEKPAGIPLDDNKFGCWKVEGNFTRARHEGPKRYIWDLNGKIEVKCAGMPDNIKEHMTFDNFHVGYANYDKSGIKPGQGKLKPLLVPGGRTLVDSPYRLMDT